MSDPRSSDVSKDSFRPPRTIVICFDGTNGQYDSMNTNVVKFYCLLRKDCPDQQVAYYQPGIGTYFAPGVVSPLWTRLASLLDEAVGWYLDVHIMGGYKFLMDNYRAGDKICLFGFSRGAYTARALAGMLDKVGLLSKGNVEQVNFAYKAYTRIDKEGVKLAAGFKQTFSQNVKIDFLGVWDTVQSTGVLLSRALPFTASNTAIRVFRHALSLDEHRVRFRPNQYHWPPLDNEPDEVVEVENAVIRKSDAVKSTFERLFKRKNPMDQPYQKLGYGTFADVTPPNGSDDQVSSNGAKSTAKFVAEESSPTDVLEVWFSGCHSDIGGGSVGDDVNVSLAQITLHWMVEHVIRSRCGILFDDNELARIGFTLSPQSPATNGQELPDPNINDVTPASTDADTAQEAVDAGCSAVQALSNKPNQPTPNPYHYVERSDAIAPLYDELKINKLWWILEILPVSNAWQDANGAWHSQWSINLGKGRLIPLQKPKFHHTVKERMNYNPLKYKPRASYDNDVVYV